RADAGMQHFRATDEVGKGDTLGRGEGLRGRRPGRGGFAGFAEGEAVHPQDEALSFCQGEAQFADVAFPGPRLDLEIGEVDEATPDPAGGKALPRVSASVV